MARLAGKRAIVTGAGSGIGRASARLFAAEGACVLAVDKTADAVAETAALISAADGRAEAVAADVSSEQAVHDFVARAVTDFGGIDVLYANAGIGGIRVPLLEQTPELWRQVLEVNLIGVFLCLKHVAAPMLAQGSGSIICTASVAALGANAGGSPYSASKAGVVSLVQTAANELSGSGVRVNAICPGLIETGMTKPLFDRARARGSEDRIGQLNPLQRHGMPDEIAQAALFLASDDSSYVNGQALPVDGGLSSTLPHVVRRQPGS